MRHGAQTGFIVSVCVVIKNAYSPMVELFLPRVRLKMDPHTHFPTFSFQRDLAIEHAITSGVWMAY